MRLKMYNFLGIDHLVLQRRESYQVDFINAATKLVLFEVVENNDDYFLILIILLKILI